MENEKSEPGQDKKIHELQSMAREHFISLAPMHGAQGGHYLKTVRIPDYENLGYTLESLLNVCIMALDGQGARNGKRDIKEAHRQFADVLELAKTLIPHEELEFLDRSKRLLLDNRKEQ